MNLHSRLETVVGIVRSVTLSAGGEYPEGSTSWLSKFRAKFLLVIWMKNVYFLHSQVKLCRRKLGVAVTILWQINCHTIQQGDQLG